MGFINHLITRGPHCRDILMAYSDLTEMGIFSGYMVDKGRCDIPSGKLTKEYEKSQC